MDFGYEDEVLFPITLNADSTLKVPSTAPLSAHVDWLVCREVCIPGKTDLALPLQVTAQKGAGDPGRQALFDRFRSLLPQPLPSSSKAVFGTTPGGFALAVTGHPVTNAEFFPLEQSQIVNAAPQPVRAVNGGVEISLKRDENFRTPAGATQRSGLAGRRHRVRDSRSARRLAGRRRRRPWRGPG